MPLAEVAAFLKSVLKNADPSTSEIEKCVKTLKSLAAKPPSVDDMKATKVGQVVNGLRKHANADITVEATRSLAVLRDVAKAKVASSSPSTKTTKRKKKSDTDEPAKKKPRKPSARDKNKMPGTGNILPPPPCEHPKKNIDCGTVARKRVRVLREGTSGNDGPVVYWMSRDQRAKDNWALLFAQALAEDTRPVVVVFNLLTSYLNAPLRHFDFMIRGLKETEKTLRAHGIPFYVTTGKEASYNVSQFVLSIKASSLVCDFSPLTGGRSWRDAITVALDEAEEKGKGDIPFFEVDTHNIVPVWLASEKQEWAAATFRKRIYEHLPTYLKEIPSLEIVEEADVLKQIGSLDPDVPDGKVYGGGEGTKLTPWDTLIKGLKCDTTIGPVKGFTPGPQAAEDMMNEFFTKRLKAYSSERNVPSINHLSHLSPYYHYGQISPQRVALEVVKLKTKYKESVEAFFEESVVRRELSDNYCYYQPNHAKFEGIPPWAKKTLSDHEDDQREYIYNKEAMEKGKTHDDLWNACQQEMVYGGKMHGFCRMYWAKKILEWSASPQEAFEFAVKQNDKYSLDGRDPNGYVGCAWAIGGVHDRAWTERSIFGKIRFMNYAGCKRKFNISDYIRRVKALPRL